MPVNDYEDIYEVSDAGRLRRVKRTCPSSRPRVLSGTRMANGYVGVLLWRDGRGEHRYMHRVVLEAFAGAGEGVVNHKDGRKHNNALANLEYGTYAHNNLHAYRTGLKRCMHTKLDADKVREIRLLKPTTSYQKLADKYGVAIGTIQQIFTGKTWVHVE